MDHETITRVPPQSAGVDERKEREEQALVSLLASLGNGDGQVRKAARRGLARIGRPAVARLIEALRSPDARLRWEAAKTLGDIGDPAAARSLVGLLDDDAGGVRWVATDALVALKFEAVVPILEGLIDRANSVWMRDAARYILNALPNRRTRQLVAPVVVALSGLEPELQAPQAAHAVLASLRTGEASLPG